MEDAYPLLLRLDAQPPDDPKLATKRKAVVEVPALLPEGRHRKAFEKERDA